jgi:co-chaperonin GroES (HSP10)
MNTDNERGLIPANWRLLVKPRQPKRKTSGGILLPEEAVKAQKLTENLAQVIAVGPLAYQDDKFREHPKAPRHRDCEVGDWVLFNRHSGLTVDIRGDDGESVRYKFINDDDVIASSKNPDDVLSVFEA